MSAFSPRLCVSVCLSVASTCFFSGADEEAGGGRLGAATATATAAAAAASCRVSVQEAEIFLPLLLLLALAEVAQ